MASNLRPALFLNRDSVINVERNYVCLPEYFKFIGGVFDLCRKANAVGMVILIMLYLLPFCRKYHYIELYRPHPNNHLIALQ